MTHMAGLPELLGLVFLALPFVALNAVGTYVAVRLAIKRSRANTHKPVS